MGHQISVELLKAKPQSKVGVIEKNIFGAGPKKPRVDTMHRVASTVAYKKLTRTAYELALKPSFPLSAFEVMVKCQPSNDVTLIDGKHDGRPAKEFIKSIYKAVTGKVAVILASKHAMSLFSEGSQARKTGAEKELVLIRMGRNGIYMYCQYCYLLNHWVYCFLIVKSLV